MIDENLSTEDIINLYPEILKELKKRKVIETNNLVGEVGQFLAREHYNKNPKLPNLDPAAVGTKHIDAISRKGERYSIKSASSGVTGNFFGLEPPPRVAFISFNSVTLTVLPPSFFL